MNLLCRALRCDNYTGGSDYSYNSSLFMSYMAGLTNPYNYMAGASHSDNLSIVIWLDSYMPRAEHICSMVKRFCILVLFFLMQQVGKTENAH